RRSRGIEACGQFKGQRCQEPLGDSEACVAIASCAPPSPTRCLPGDFRINILGSTPRKKLLYNGYFNGACQLVSDIRLPWNVAGLNLETRVEKTLSSRIHDSTQHLVREVLSESHSNGGVGLSIQSVPVIKMPVVHESTNVIEEILESTGKRFVRINSKVQTASYRLRSRDLRVTSGFIKDVGSLPVEYEKGTYFNFIEDYGTHYTRSGNLGGEYDLIYILDTNEIKKRKPIYNAFPLNMPDANARISNMKRAIVDYVAEYNVCKCKPCHNNGTAVLVDGMCSCLCKPAYKGLACQNHDADKGAKPQGAKPQGPKSQGPKSKGPKPQCTKSQCTKSQHDT
ncbi:hypothetical protein CRUP_024952, partial [Coryphaenoides rupestris]